MRGSLKSEIKCIKYMFKRIEENGLTVGDRFSIDNFSMSPSYHSYASGAYLMSMVERGILQVVDKELVKVGYHGTKVITIKELIRDMKNGSINGTFYTRNVYEIKSDNFKEYMTELIEEMCE